MVNREEDIIFAKPVYIKEVLPTLNDVIKGL
jgi:hypothetical protein